MIVPSKKEFLELVREGRTVPLYEEIPFQSPQSLYEVFRSLNTFLLESIKGPEKIARYSFIGFDTCLALKIKNGYTEVEVYRENIYKESYQKLFVSREPSSVLKQGRRGDLKIIPVQQLGVVSKRPHIMIKELITSYKQSPHRTLPPFQGGLVGILSYDFVQYFEKLPQNALDDLYLPDAHFFIIDRMVALDHFRKKAWIIVCPGVMESLGKDRVSWHEKYDEAAYEIKKIQKKTHDNIVNFESKNRNANIELSKQGGNIDIVYEMKKNVYMDMVKRAKDYIADGDIFQANLSQRVSSYIGDKSPWGLYKKLSSINPSPFAAFIDFGDYQIVSSSPERLIRVKNGVIETRPIAGTRPRGMDKREDELMRIELLLNEKERAEHIMLIDLERNDIGKVSYYGSVIVDELMITENCSHVMHIVSNIRGDLARGKDCFDVIKATFPGGTITGVPKVRCMEIIDELEPVRRGPYTGSIGYISFSGNLDLNIIIRTFVIKDGRAYVQVGAGIVADSDPEREYHETLKKAEALLRTLESV